MATSNGFNWSHFCNNSAKYEENFVILFLHVFIVFLFLYIIGDLRRPASAWPITAKLLRCDWLGRNRLIITRAVRHLATATFQNGLSRMVVATRCAAVATGRRVSRYWSVLRLCYLLTTLKRKSPASFRRSLCQNEQRYVPTSFASAHTFAY